MNVTKGQKIHNLLKIFPVSTNLMNTVNKILQILYDGRGKKMAIMITENSIKMGG